MYVGAPAGADERGWGKPVKLPDPERHRTTLRTFCLSRWYHYFSTVQINLSDQAQVTLQPTLSDTA